MHTLFRKLGGIGSAFPILLVLLALCIASYFAITSATFLNDKLQDAPVAQLKYTAVGFAVFLLLALTPYQLLVRISPVLFLCSVMLLIGVFLTRASHGAQSWIRLGGFSFEPAAWRRARADRAAWASLRVETFSAPASPPRAHRAEARSKVPRQADVHARA